MRSRMEARWQQGGIAGEGKSGVHCGPGLLERSSLEQIGFETHVETGAGENGEDWMRWRTGKAEEVTCLLLEPKEVKKKRTCGGREDRRWEPTEKENQREEERTEKRGRGVER